MVNSDEDLREAEEGLERESEVVEPAVADEPAESLSDLAPSSPEDVAKKILREAFKSFPIPGKK